MTSNAERSATLAKALHASLDHDPALVDALCTEDVKAWTPGLAASSAVELAAALALRDEAFSDVDLEVVPLDVGGDYAAAEWRVEMTHTGRLVLGEGVEVEPTGIRIALNGVTVAEFDGHRICSLRQYWDELTLFDQLGLLEDA